MKYTPATIAKSLISGVVAFVGAAAAGAHGADLSTLDLGGWMLALGSGVTAAGAVFATPKKQQPADAGEAEPAPPIADVAIDAVQQTVQNAAHGVAELDRVMQVARDVISATPVTVEPIAGRSPGTLADEVIRAVLPLPRT